MDVNLIKAGGSVISRESSEDKFEKSVVQRLGRELHSFKDGLILVHGTGFVGKPPAIKYGYYRSGHSPRENNLVMLSIKEEVRLLNHRFVETLLGESIPAVPFAISHVFTESMDCVQPDAEAELRRTLKNGYVPVFYGDVIVCSDGSFRIFSSDIIVLLLSKIFQPKKVLFLSDVDGVYERSETHPDEEARLLRVLNPQSAASLLRSDYDGQDVSGGMLAKVKCALEIAGNCEECLIGSGNVPGITEKFLAGKKVAGTRVEPGAG